MRYFIHFANNEHQSFWASELRALCDLHKIDFDSLGTSVVAFDSPLVIADFPSEEVAASIVSRSVLAKSLYELLFEAGSFEQLCERFATCDLQKAASWFDDPARSFRVLVHAINRKLAMADQVQRITALLAPFDGMRSPVNLSSPDQEFAVFEEYEFDKSRGTCVRKDVLRVFMGRLVCHGMRRDRHRFKISDRNFIGNTTMDVTLAFLMANHALVSKNDIVYDPFVGSGSLLLACSHFGAYTAGADIDYNIVHGLGKSSRSKQTYRAEGENLWANYEQYDLARFFLGTMVADSSRGHLLFRPNILFDAIVTDPPYGIRESSRRVRTQRANDSAYDNHIPAKETYDIGDSVIDLVSFAAVRLKLGGRLVFWLPAVKADFSIANIPKHASFQLVSCSAQSLSKRIERRLVVLEKVQDAEQGRAVCEENHYERSFRERYFQAEEKPTKMGSDE